MEKILTKKELMKEIENFLEKNAVPFDNFIINIELEERDLISITKTKECRLSGKLK